jgi:endonuclease YncB( thermonuclease family)
LNKKYALLLALLLALSLANAFYLFSFAEKKSSQETAIVARVIDGDTLQLRDGRTIRLINVNSPEKGMPNADLSKQFLKSFENKSIQIETTEQDKYQRTLARIYSSSLYLNLELVEQGLASKYIVEDNELSLFAKAEENAINQGKGMWEPSPFKGCVKTSIDFKKEIVLFKVLCNSLSIKGWFLKDESRKTYSFKDSSANRFQLHSGKGENNETDLFWGSSASIWNDDRDSLYLFDEQGRIVAYETYGY